MGVYRNHLYINNTLECMIGQRFGRWTAKQRTIKNGRESVFVCKCDCGNEAVIDAYKLRTGISISCKECRRGIPLEEVRAIKKELRENYDKLVGRTPISPAKKAS